ncbi:MAG TPA: primosomal protein N', partial [Thermoleophilia bacterium]|nr:primosomal protein N' [Thermoleophilia bacterium]
MPRIAKVVVEIAIGHEFDYLVPDALADRVQIGSRVIVPFGRSEARGFVVGFADSSPHPGLKEIRDVVGHKPLIGEKLLELARWMGDYYAAPVEQAVHTVLPGAVRRKGAGFKERLFVFPGAAATDVLAVEDLRKRAPKQAAVLDLLLTGDSMFLHHLARAAKTSAQTVRALEEKGFVRIGRQAQERDPLAGQTILRTDPLKLMPQQEAAFELVKKSIDTRVPPVVLLYGVTGSGKTEVYLQALDYVLKQGKGAVILVPEISLTPQTVERFRGRFGESIAVLHSHLSQGERHDEWHRVHEGRARIAIGARSAVFAPVKDLGLIVVDEEHENSYKQEEAPRYNARDVAVMRGRMEACAVLLGSATPSLESFHNAQRGKYGLAELPHRVDHRRMPSVRVVDMRIEAEKEGRAHVLSVDLVEAIRGRLDRAEQTILFLNRRGFATSLVCHKCGYVARCDACSVAMTYHRATGKLHCHVCGAGRVVPAKCPNPECRDPSFRYAGIGTQRVEDVVTRMFPHARVHRMDADTTTRKNSHSHILGDFRTGK